MLINRSIWPVTRVRVPALPRLAAFDGITMSTAQPALGVDVHTATNADAAYGKGDPTAWSPPV